MTKTSKLLFCAFIIMTLFLFAGCKGKENIEDNQYTISFSGIDEVIENISIKDGETFVLPNPSKTGYDFQGWFYNGALVSGKFDFGKDITLEARWVKSMYLINLNTDGANETYSPIAISYEDNITLPVPTKTGYRFLGWYLNNDLFTESKYNYTNDINLLAKWEKIQYHITFDIDGIDPIDVYYLDRFVLPSPTKAGYNFLGWYNGENLFNDNVLNEASDINLTAKWEKTTYVISFDVAGVNPINVKYQDSFTLPTPTKTGYRFLGWYDGENLFTDGVLNEAKNISLVAKWEKVAYQISFDVEGIDPINVYYQDQLSLPTPTKTGYNFLGWYKGNTLYNATTFLDATNVSLTAKWEKVTYKISFDVTGVAAINVKYQESYTLPTPTKTGYNFLGWYNGETKVVSGVYNETTNISLNAKWEAKTVEVSFNANGGDETNLEKVNVTFDQSVTLPITSREGYAFDGWYNGNTKVVDGKWAIDSNVTLNAKWKANSYEISLDGAGATLTTNKISVNYDENFTLPTPTKTGYSFLGWYMEEEKIVSGKYNYLSNIALIAKWQVNSYVVTLDADGGTCANQTVNVTYGEAYDLGVASKDGYDFTGWYNENTIVNNPTWNIDGNVTLKAAYTPTNYEIKYYDGSNLIDSFAEDAYSYNVEKVNFSLPTYVKEGFVFRGWYEEDDFSGEKVTSIDELKAYVLYAKLEEEVIKKVNLTLDLNGGYYYNFNLDDLASLKAMFLADAKSEGDAFDSKYSNVAAEKAFNVKMSVLGKDVYKWDFLLAYFANVNTNDWMQYFFNYYIANHDYPDASVASAAGYNHKYDNYYLSYESYAWYSSQAASWTNTNSSRNIVTQDGVYNLVTIDGIITYLASNQVNTFVIKDDTLLPTVYKDGYKFLGWYEDSEFNGEAISVYPKNVDEVKNVTLYAKWEKIDVAKESVHAAMEEIETMLSSLGVISANIILPVESNGCTITWYTTDKDALSTTGAYGTPNKDVKVTLTAEISYDAYSRTVSQELDVKRFYSDLTNGLTAGYVYKGEMATMSDYTIENLDIAYVAFAYPRDDGSVDVSSIKSYLNDFVTRCHSHGTYVVLSLQEHEDGGENKDSFSIISASAEMRELFNNNLINIINTYHLDGIDMDWEHPDEGEEECYTDLMRDLYAAIKANNKYHLLTTATSGADKYNRFNLTESINYIDYINLMTYDLHSSSRSQFTSALERGGSSKNYRGIDQTYQSYVTELHMPTNKLILGIAFYGLIYHETDGIYTSAPKAITEKKAYSYIYDNYISQVNGDTIQMHWDDTAKGYYVYDSENRICTTFDDPVSIGYKVAQAYNWGFAGVMYWRDGQDRGDELVTAMVNKVNEYYIGNE